MAINAWQLCRFTVEGVLFEQSIKNVFWFAPNNAIPENTMMEVIRYRWRSIMHFLVSDYRVSRYVLEPLLRLECVVGPSEEEEGDELKFIRPVFNGKIALSGTAGDTGDQAGANDGFILPSFVALSVTKSPGKTFEVQDSDGTISATESTYPGRAGSCRISGLREIENRDAQGNQLKQSFQDSWNANMANLVAITRNAEGLTFGATINQYLLSLRHPGFSTTGGWRIFRGDPPQTDPSTWHPNVAVSEVVRMNVSEYLTSQTSRVQRRKFN
jgi:hypothetical protein